MGRGGGFHGGGGGHHYRSHRSRRSRSHRSSGKGGKDEEASVGVALFMTCVVGLVAAGALAVLIVVVVLFARLPAVCDGADSLNRGEQRLCQPTTTSDVRLSARAADVTAYRYATAELPATENHTETFTAREEIRYRYYRYFNFALSAGGTAAWNYTLDKSASVYLMNLTQFRAFERTNTRENLWRRVGQLEANGAYTAAVPGVYYLVVENRNSGARKVTAVESVTVTTAVYRVGDASAGLRDSCAANTKCVFRDVTPEETVIAQYTGTRQSVDVALHNGKGKFNTQIISPVIVCAVVLLGAGPYAILLCVGLVLLIAEKREKAKNGPAPDSAPKTPDGGPAKVAQPTTDPVPLTPLGPTPGTGPAYPEPDAAYPDGVPPGDSAYSSTGVAGYDSLAPSAPSTPSAPPADSGAPSGAEWKA